MKSPLVGRWCHGWEAHDGSRHITYQGHIVAAPAADLVLIQLFEWFNGTPTCQQLFRLSDLVGWTFYDEQDEMRGAWQVYDRSGGCRACRNDEIVAHHLMRRHADPDA